MKYTYLLIFTLFSFSNASNFYYEFDKKVELSEKSSTKALLEDGIKEYTTSDGKIKRFKNEILVQCNKGAYCEDDFSDLNLTNFTKIDDTFYVVKLDSTQDIFEYCQKLYEKNDIKSAHPNYISTREKR